MNRQPLPDDIRARIAADFPSGRRHAATEALLALVAATPEPARVARCVLLVANGSYKEFARMIELANTDYRDAIVAAEYDRRDRRLRDLSKPFGQNELS